MVTRKVWEEEVTQFPMESGEIESGRNMDAQEATLCLVRDMNLRSDAPFVIIRRANNLDNFKAHVGIHSSLFGF